MAHSTWLPTRLQVPCEGVAETNEALEGRKLVAVTPVAAVGPLLTTVMVLVRRAPTAMGSGWSFIATRISLASSTSKLVLVPRCPRLSTANRDMFVTGCGTVMSPVQRPFVNGAVFVGEIGIAATPVLLRMTISSMYQPSVLFPPLSIVSKRNRSSIVEPANVDNARLFETHRPPVLFVKPTTPLVARVTKVPPPLVETSTKAWSQVVPDSTFTR